MRSLIAFALVFAGAAAAQDAANPPALTAEQILDKSIEAAGGRASMEKITSTVSKFTIDVTFAGVTATSVAYAKAPNKRAMTITIEGYGNIREGFDGTNAWGETPEAGLRDFTGERLEQAKRQAIFNAALKWRETYPKAELKGKEKVGEREAWAIILTPKTGKPMTEYIDAETFLPIRQVMSVIGDQGEYEATNDVSDYREVDGVKVPFLIRQTSPMGDIIIKVAEVKNNVEIDDANFAKPK